VSVLNWERAGNPEGRGLVLAHGFTQTRRLWGEFGVLLGRTHLLVLVDLPGHGGSSAVRADLDEGADRIVEAAGEALGDEPFDLLGYSLGARFALHAALSRPDRVARLVVIGATGGIDDPESARARRARDDALADSLESSGDLGGFLERWLSAPMFAGLRPTAADLGERMHNTPEGLASSLRLAGTGTQAPLWDRLRQLRAPALILAGQDDPRFVANGARLAQAIPSAAFALVPGARHAAHLHQPAITARMVASWLDTSPVPRTVPLSDSD
jgi:2-succinyl-6-hydroxy-2,4-cyclohexadiene-1-carboxylate synthase